MFVIMKVRNQTFVVDIIELEIIWWVVINIICMIDLEK